MLKRALRVPFNLMTRTKHSRLKQLIPGRLFNVLKVLNYNFWLGYTIFTQDAGMNPFNTVRLLFKPRTRLLFYPDVPWEESMMFQFCLILRYSISNNPRKRFDLGVFWEPGTTVEPDENLSTLAKSQWILNYNCSDISKRHVNEVFKQVFGYDSFIDPLTFEGKCVVKSDQNATHDGEILTCPMASVEPGKIYQRLIDNETGDGFVMDIRVPVTGANIPFIFLFSKPSDIRFSAARSGSKTLETDDVFSSTEQAKILQFCATLGMDYGELDILRDKDDGRIYIVDANPTPHGPPTHLGTQKQGMIRLAHAFADSLWHETDMKENIE